MNINWIDMAGLLIVVWVAYDRIKKLEAENRRLEIRCNTNEMNIKKLHYFRDIEAYEKNGELSEVDRQAFKDELEADLETLAERNKFLMAR